MPSKPYDVVLIPDPGLAGNALELSRKLEPMGTYFVLDGKTFFPHVSLYMLQLNDAGLEQAINLLSAMADRAEAIECVADEYHYEGGYLDIEYAKSQELTALQEKVIDMLNPVRDGLREKDKARLADATGETRSNILKYGYRSVGNLFSPHLTFTRFTADREAILRSLPAKDLFNGTYVGLGIFELGDHGTCVRKVKAFDFRQRA